MGTNYYMYSSRYKQELDMEGVHLGKNSWGWVFHFQAHSAPRVKTVEDMKAFTKMGFIYDEYDREITYEDFWKMVEKTKKPMPDGTAKYVLVDPNYPNDPIYDSWEDEGFAFTEGDFC